VVPHMSLCNKTWPVRAMLCSTGRFACSLNGSRGTEARWVAVTWACQHAAVGQCCIRHHVVMELGSPREARDRPDQGLAQSAQRCW
jgi:hypothetical protein